MGSRFVQPDVAVLKISNGDTLTVRRRLNAGERRAMMARMYTAGVDGTLKSNVFQIGVARALTYLLDWSLTDEGGALVAIRDQPIDVVQAALDALDIESFNEVDGAIFAHETAMEAERAKNSQASESNAPAISPSPSAPAGESNGSAN